MSELFLSKKLIIIYKNLNVNNSEELEISD